MAIVPRHAHPLGQGAGVKIDAGKDLLKSHANWRKVKVVGQAAAVLKAVQAL